MSTENQLVATCCVAALVLVGDTAFVAEVRLLHEAWHQSDHIEVILPMEERQHRAGAFDVHAGQTDLLGEDLNYIIRCVMKAIIHCKAILHLNAVSGKKRGCVEQWQMLID